MRWIVKVFALGVTMALLHRVAGAAPLDARAALALGFVLCAAWLGAGMARRLRLPHVTGFLLLGFCIGPAWLNVVRVDELGALGFVGDAALALVTLAAGVLLVVPVLQGERRALTRLAAGTIAFPFVAVALVVLSVSRWFPITAHQSFGGALIAALALATLAVTSSPLLTASIMEDPGARDEGHFARTILEVTVVKDLAAPLVLAFVLALGGWLTRAGAAHGGLGVALLEDVLASLAAGVVVGMLLDHYLGLHRGNAAVALGAFAFVTSMFARLLGLDVVFIALATGFVVVHRSHARGARLHGALRDASLPVYAVAFTLMGAGLRAQALAELWPWVLLLVGLRLVSLRYGTLWAGRDRSVVPALAERGWLGLISQAGIVLSLATTVRRAFPGWGVSFETLVATMVAVHTLVGPVALRYALGRAGEQGEERPVVSVSGDGDGDGVGEQLSAIPVP